MSQYPQLDNAIWNLKKNGMTDEHILKELKNSGWNDSDIAESYKAVNKNINNNVNIPEKTPPVSASTGTESPGSVGNMGSVNTIKNKEEQTGIKNEVFNKKTKNSKSKIIPVVVILLLIAAGGSAYYLDRTGYININPFKSLPYSESNLASGILSKIGEIDSSRNVLAFDFYIEDRDENAISFSELDIDDKELKERYERDVKRVDSISIISRELDYYYRENNNSYPKNIQELLNDQENYNSYFMPEYRDGSFSKDPFTEKDYEYTLTENGENFKIIIDFETDEMINILSDNLNLEDEFYKYDYEINGKTAIFDKEDFSYLYVRRELPNSFYESLAEMTQYLPPDINVTGSFISELEREENNNLPERFSLGLRGEGDLGDLTYKVDVEALKTEEGYFFRLNNFPSFFLSFFGYVEKGKWIKLDSEEDSLSILPNPEELEEDYEEYENELAKAVKMAVRIADQEKLFTFKSNPSQEKVDNKTLYKYELDIEQQTFKNFYKRFIEELESDPETKVFANSESKAVLRFIESKDYSKIFDFYRDNLDFTLLVDNKGFPALFEMKIRVIPSEESYTLKDKQLILKIKTEIGNINRKLDIKTPKDYTEMKDLYDNSPLSGARDKGSDASIKANLSNTRAQAELVYDDYRNYNGVCEDSTIKNAIEAANSAYDEGEVVLCRDGSDDGANDSWAIVSPLKSEEESYFCVDSTGSAKLLTSNNIGSGIQQAKCY